MDADLTPRRVTAHMPGSLGVLTATAEDFEVREILAYAPSGQGDHLFVEIEKIGINTFDAVKRVAHAAGLTDARGEPSRDIGYAGLKDRHARARQWISLPLSSRAEIPPLNRAEGTELRILNAVRHDRKIRRGHQRANRFHITIRDVPEGGRARAQAILDHLRKVGVPNYFGPQRFGVDGANAEKALAFVRGKTRPPRDRRLRDLLVSALQSAVYNRVLETRIARDLFAAALLGDVMQKHDTGGLFDVTDALAEQPRVDALAISPTAALPGKRARLASGEPAKMEEAALHELGLTDADVIAIPADGTRRALRYPIDPEAAIVPAGEDAYRLEVTLPSGAYATVILDEIVKPPDGRFDRVRF